MILVIFEKDKFDLNSVPVPLMLVIGDVFSMVKRPVLILQTATSANTNSEVLEGLFVGLWTSQLLAMSVATSFINSRRAGGTKIICAGALASGSALLTIIMGALPVLGPGPSLGALMGVAGAAGVALSAAGAEADSCGPAGKVGAMLGAGVGAALGSRFHGGLSWTFIALSAAVIPGADYLKLILRWLQQYRIFAWLSWIVSFLIAVLCYCYFALVFFFSISSLYLEFNVEAISLLMDSKY